MVVYVYTQGMYQGEVQAPRDHDKLRSSYVGELAPTGTFASLRHLRIIFRGRLQCQDVLKTGQPSETKRRTHALSPVSLTPHHGCPTHIFGELLPQRLQERITRLQCPHNMTTGMSGPCLEQSSSNLTDTTQLERRHHTQMGERRQSAPPASGNAASDRLRFRRCGNSPQVRIIAAVWILIQYYSPHKRIGPP